MKHIIYTLKHKAAFLKTEKRLKGKISLQGILHDLDKLVLYLMFCPDKYETKFHRKFANHHERDCRIKNIEEAIIDWECARITKPEKPLNARDTYQKYYSYVSGVEEKLVKLGL